MRGKYYLLSSTVEWLGFAHGPAKSQKEQIKEKEKKERKEQKKKEQHRRDTNSKTNPGACSPFQEGTQVIMALEGPRLMTLQQHDC